MTSNTRRPGFRLWGGDSAGEPDESATEQSATEQAATEQAATEQAATEQVASEQAPASAAAPSAEGAALTGATAETPAPEPPPESAGFLASLVAAMRAVAEEARDSSLADFRGSVETRIGELEASAAERANDLRQQADADIAGIGEWERSEKDRITTEAEQKTQARRAHLEQQLKDHHTASEAQVATIRGRLADHEKQLAAFFTQLTEIRDPGAFVAAAKQMPRPPEIGGAVQSEPAAPSQTLDMRLAALGVERADGEAATTEATEAPAESAAAPEAAAQAAEPAQGTPPVEAVVPTEAPATEPVQSAPPAEAAAPATTPTAATSPEAAPPAAAGEGRDTALADRLAELDAQLAESSEPAAPSNGTAEPAAAGEPAAETSTAIVVKGLGSFGAITSFKQALERVDGVLGVTLSLGPTGEFVYRASHGAEFDLVAAIRSIEGPTAEIEQAEGSVQVSVSRNR